MRIDLSKIPIETGTNYPANFRSAVAGRSRQRIGNAAGLKNFGVNLTTLAPGSQSALRHWHSAQDEFVYILQGEAVLVTDAGEQTLGPGEMAGFAAGIESGHHLVNQSVAPVVYLEVGDRSALDQVNYPDQDLRCVPDTNGQRRFVHKDGSTY